MSGNHPKTVSIPDHQGLQSIDEIQDLIDSNGSKLCDLCTALDFRPDVANKHQPSFRALEASANWGCRLCRFLHYGTLCDFSRFWRASGISTSFIAKWNRNFDQMDILLRQRDPEAETGFVFQRLRGKPAVPFEYRRLPRYVLNDEDPDKFTGELPKVGEGLHASEGMAIFASATKQSDEYPLARTFPSTPNLEFCRRWYTDCTSRSGAVHENCLPLCDVPLPTRLIAVGRHGEDEISLVETAGMMGQYATLSHVWGSGSQLFKTTRVNLEQRLHSMSLDSLPATFRDAVLVVRALELEYLWIDMLCIVQDVEADWQHECTRMNLIYSNSAITLAAAAASDPQSGFLGPRKPVASLTCNVSTPNAVKACGGGSISLRFIHAGGMFPRDSFGYVNIPPSKLHTRAWVFQERCLSPRVLTFHETELFFQCRGGKCRETFPEHVSEGNNPLGPFSVENLPAERVKYMWWIAIQDYSEKELTNQSDILPAISGVARKMKEYSRTNSEEIGDYAAGVWIGPGLDAVGLVWCCFSQPKQYPNQDSPTAPSWSWASIDRPIKYMIEYSQYPPLRQTIHSCNVEPASLDEYGNVKRGGVLEISAYAMSWTLDSRDSRLIFASIDAESSPYACWTMDMTAQFSREGRYESVPDDLFMTFIPDDEQRFVKSPHSYHEPQFSRFTCIGICPEAWLVLEPSSAGRYRRVGVCDVDLDALEVDIWPRWVEENLEQRRFCIE